MSTLFIGLGKMGDPMVRQYAPTHPTIVYDVNHDAATVLASDTGADVIDDLGDIPSQVDTVILMLPNSRIVESVLRGPAGLLNQLSTGSLIIDMGSSEPASTRTLAAEAAKHGISYVDAPVSGGVAKASTGRLSVMVGGAPADIDRAIEHIEPIGSTIVKVGGPGAGHAAKALNNLVSATNIAVAAEALTVAKRFGIEADVMVEVLNSSTGRSQASEVKYPQEVLTGRFNSGFAMDLMLKDIKIAHELSETTQASTPITDTAVTTLVTAREALTSDNPDHTEVARYYEIINTVKLRTSK